MKQITLNQLVLQKTPVRPGNAVRLYVDDDLYGRMRVTVFGYPNQEKVYFDVERVNKDFELICTFESSFFANMDELVPQLEGLIEIPLP